MLLLMTYALVLHEPQPSPRRVVRPQVVQIYAFTRAQPFVDLAYSTIFEWIMRLFGWNSSRILIQGGHLDNWLSAKKAQDPASEGKSDLHYLYSTKRCRIN
jgi:hypothetical protein